MEREKNRNSKNVHDVNDSAKSRRRPALVVLGVLIVIAAVFLLSDAPYVKGLRDSLMGRLGYVSEEKVSEDNASEEKAPEAPADETEDEKTEQTASQDAGALDASKLPEYNGSNYVNVNSGVPEFPEKVYKKAGLIQEGDKWKTKGNLLGTVDSNKVTAYEFYNSLDKLGRCQTAYGCLGRETMPEENAERGDISSIHPSGWAKGQNWERCHLIAWSLSAENANPGILITGTHYLNYDGMRPLEEETAHYIWSTDNHVLYMSEPVYSGNELIARGVHMMARSVEDNGDGLSFNVYCFNVTPGADIDYTGGVVTTEEQAAQGARLYVVNKRSRVFHYPSCDGAKSISKKNREEVTATRTELTSQGYTPCGACEP